MNATAQEQVTPAIVGRCVRTVVLGTLSAYIIPVGIDFDPSKSEWNRKERGFSFGYAARIFLGRTLISFARMQAGEVRMKETGDIEAVIYAVIFFDTNNMRRIVSARAASRKERQEWLASE